MRQRHCLITPFIRHSPIADIIVDSSPPLLISDFNSHAIIALLLLFMMPRMLTYAPRSRASRDHVHRQMIIH